MKKAARSVIVFFISFMAITPACLAQGKPSDNEPPKEMSMWQARRAVALCMKWGYVRYFTKFTTVQAGTAELATLRFTFDQIAVAFKDEKGKSLHIKRDLLAGDKRDEFTCTDEDCKGYRKFRVSAFHRDETDLDCAKLSGYERAICLDGSKWYESAIEELRRRAAKGSSTSDFHQQAAAWRSQTPKPPAAEGVRVQRLLAEEAVDLKQLDGALNHYELGVEADPMWATGWHNAALLAGELGYFADAAQHIQNYLELMPGADDAQAARDYLEIWKYKAAH